MHYVSVERLVEAEAEALRQAVADGVLPRVERRDTLLVAEVPWTIYPSGRLNTWGPTVPLLGQRREATIIAALDCTQYDTDPPSLAFFADWEATMELAFEQWPKGIGMVQRHPKTGKPFLCRPGIREFHTHVQHGDEPWDKYRGRVRPRDLFLNLARDLRQKQVVA